MSTFKFTNVFVGVVLGLILALHTNNVEGAPDLARCKTAYANFFNSLEAIITGGASVVTTARTTYNTCATNAETLAALITCAVTAYDTYELHLRDVLQPKARPIISAYYGFADVIVPLTVNAGLPEAQTGVAIPLFRQLVNEAMTWQATAIQRRGGA